MTEDQARAWGAASGADVAHEPLSAAFGPPVCVLCLATHDSGDGPCPGVPENPGHAWEARLVAPVIDELSDDEGWAIPPYPQSIAVGCILCGQSATEADDVCPERAMWIVQEAT